MHKTQQAKLGTLLSMPCDQKDDSDQDSVSEWIADMKRGDSMAVASLWERYFERICQLADKKLAGASRSFVDEHDLAIGAMRAIWEGAQKGRFRRLQNREDLWQLLVVITKRKAANVHRDQHALKQRRGRRSDFHPSILLDFVELIESPPTETLIDQIPLSCRELLSRLNERDREIALMRLAGHSNREIAVEQNCSVATVERHLRNIREVWSDHDPSL
ncbi:ECF-type sigma factor [Stieleria sp.]|uniref:ECF-type sigma factor n=1 Tax=Stieleria sp. TaxID=2795976 RepID=UPI00356A834F